MNHYGAPLWASALLLTALVSTTHGDFTYAWTEYSLEWITDAASAIASGEITACSEEGRFECRIQAVLKERADLALQVGQTVEGPCLGRSVHHEHGEGVGSGRLVIAASGLGMPVYSEPSSYPGSGRAFPPKPLPRVGRKKNWGPGDRVVLFFGPDVRQIIQIVNLDRPVGASVDEHGRWLAADLHGKLIVNPDELMRRLKARVAEGRQSMPDGTPRVCSHGFYYWPSRSELDGHHYYFIFAPPDPCFKDILSDAMKPELIHYATHGGELGVQPPRAALPPSHTIHARIALRRMAIWYWFYSGRTPQQYAGDRQRDFDRALRYFRGHHERRPRQMSAVRMHCRNYPHGWQCVISDSGRHFALIDRHYVHLYNLSAERPQAARPLYRADTVDRRTSRITFSPGSGYLAYSEADGGVAVYDLARRRVLWKAQFPLSDSGPIECTQLCFSPDAKYLVQVVARRKPGRRFRSLRFDRKVVHGWDVPTGRCVFAPYDQWQQWLQIVGFHKQDFRLIRLTNPERERAWPKDVSDLVWNLETGETVADPLDADDWESCPLPPRTYSLPTGVTR
ncbi:MAG: hypothetical protein ACQESR_02070 [Planctomycetota bacterium]